MRQFNSNIKAAITNVIERDQEDVNDAIDAWVNELADAVGKTVVRVPAPGIFPPPAGPGPDPTFPGSTFSLSQPRTSKAAARQLLTLAMRGVDPVTFGDLLAKAMIVLMLEGFIRVRGDYSGSVTFLPQPPPPNNAPIIIPPIPHQDKEASIRMFASQISLWCAPCLFIPAGLFKGSFVVPPVPVPFGAFAL
jgi:hypothetical protein